MQQQKQNTRYELIDAFGEVVGVFVSAQAAGARAKYLWPDQEQDEDRTGKGWDIQIRGCE